MQTEETTVTSEADLVVYSGPINYEGYQKLVEVTSSPKRARCALVMTTFGGDPHSAYRISSHLQRQYQGYEIWVFGPCKSAGTLICLGAEKLIMGACGELGPLDVQTSKNDELFLRQSGLDLMKSVDVISSLSFNIFEGYIQSFF